MKYQKYAAVFADRVTLIMNFDPDPTLNSQVQQLNNTGTTCPRSVTQYGDNDVFYLDESGLRSMRARDSSGAAATSDIGVPVDTMVKAKLVTLTLDERTQSVIGLIEPSDGRFWLIMDNQIFVFSYFPEAKVSAWTRYIPGFHITDAVIYQRKVYVRGDNVLYVYGGMGNTLTYDTASAPLAIMPYLDGEAPNKKKTFESFDAVIRGSWRVSFNTDPSAPADTRDVVAVLDNTTYWQENIGSVGTSTHISVRFEAVDSTVRPRMIGSMVIKHDADTDDE